MFRVFNDNKTTITISLLTTEGNANNVSHGYTLYKANFSFEKKITFKIIINFIISPVI